MGADVTNERARRRTQTGARCVKHQRRASVARGTQAVVVWVRGTPRSGVAINFLFESIKKECIVASGQSYKLMF